MHTPCILSPVLFREIIDAIAIKLAHGIRCQVFPLEPILSQKKPRAFMLQAFHAGRDGA